MDLERDAKASCSFESAKYGLDGCDLRDGEVGGVDYKLGGITMNMLGKLMVQD